MLERTSRPRLDPSPAWSLVTDAPLLGLSLAREAGWVLAWDEASHLILIDGRGIRIAQASLPARIIHATISDDGSFVAALIEGPEVLFLGPDLVTASQRPTPGDPLTVGTDSHGRFAIVSARAGKNLIYTRFGKLAGSFQTLQPLAHLHFVADRPLLVAATAYGMLMGFDLEPGGGPGTLEAFELWKTNVISNIGRLGVTGDGGLILASCYTHGIQRFDSRGRNEGSYHLGGTSAHAIPDFAGRTIAAATTEGDLVILNRAGNLRWKTSLGRGPIGLECDPLGRYLVYGMSTGEVVKLDLEGGTRPATSETPSKVETARPSPSSTRTVAASAAPAKGASLRAPAWTIPVAQSEEEAETAVLAVLDDPPRIALMSQRNRLRVFTITGGELGVGGEIVGIGRSLRIVPGWIIAATDRQVLLCDARRNTVERLDLSLVELTHVEAQPDSYGLALVQEGYRLGRSSVAGRWIWRHEPRSSVEEVAIGPDGLTAASTQEGHILIFDPAGEPAGRFEARPEEPLCLCAAPAGSPDGVVWVSLARRSQVLRGHRREGRIAWESPVPWEAWQMQRLEEALVVTAPDGRALAFDGSGYLKAQSRGNAPPGVFALGPEGQVLRVYRQAENLICTELSGRVVWRTLAEQPIGPIAAGRAGVAVLIGRSLAWFPTEAPPEIELD